MRLQSVYAVVRISTHNLAVDNNNDRDIRGWYNGPLYAPMAPIGPIYSPDLTRSRPLLD